MKLLDYIKDYKNENLKDSALSDIKSLCVDYLCNPSNLGEFDIDYIEICYEMIINELNDISNLKESLKIKNYNNPFYEIYTNLDEMIMAENLLITGESIKYVNLTKDINYLIDILMLCSSVLYRIIQDRKN